MRVVQLRVLLAAGACIGLLLSSCSTITPPSADLASFTLLRPTRDAATPLLYRKAGVELSSYDRVTIAPVRILAAAGIESGVLPDEKKMLAADLFREFAMSLGKRFQLVSVPGKSTLEVDLTLIDVKKSNTVLSTVSHIVPVGLAINVGAQLAGKRGTFAGSAVYAVEVRDSESGEILYAEVANQSSKALDLTASFTPLAAAKAGIHTGAQTFPNDLIGTASR